jgi:hypothetical protein
MPITEATMQGTQTIVIPGNLMKHTEGIKTVLVH